MEVKYNLEKEREEIFAKYKDLVENTYMNIDEKGIELIDKAFHNCFRCS